MNRFFVIFALLSLFLVSCKEKSKPEAFAERALKTYLDCNVREMETMATRDVVDQLRWRASNMTQAERELLAENEPDVSVESIEQLEDGAYKVVLSVSDALLLDSINMPGHIDDCRFMLLMEKGEGNLEVASIQLLTDK